MTTHEKSGDDLLTVGEVAKLLDLSVSRVRQLERDGHISCLRVGAGTRLFNADAVRTLRAERDAKRHAGGAR